MSGGKVSVLSGVLFNPLVWIGIILTLFTLKYEKNVFDVFFEPKTYGLLFAGAGVYVALFNIHYTEEGEHIDWGETLAAVLSNMGIILLTWVISLSFIVNYRAGGESLRAAMAQKMQEKAEAQAAERTYNATHLNNNTENNDIAVDEVINNMGLQGGKSYVITPQADGTISVQVIENQN